MSNRSTDMHRLQELVRLHRKGKGAPPTFQASGNHRRVASVMDLMPAKGSRPSRGSHSLRANSPPAGSGLPWWEIAATSRSSTPPWSPPVRQLLESQGPHESIYQGVVAIKESQRLPHVPGHWRPVCGLVLEAVVGLAQVVQGRQHTEPLHLLLIQVVVSPETSKTLAQDGPLQQRLEASCHVRAVILQC